MHDITNICTVFSNVRRTVIFQVRPISHQAVFSTNAYIMLYELESAPFAQKPSTVVNNKVKNNSSNSCSSNSEESLVSVKSNGISSNKVVYGPQLPSNLIDKLPNMNGTTTNGKNKHSESSSSSESDTELPKQIESKQSPIKSNGVHTANDEKQLKSPQQSTSINKPSLSTSHASTNGTKESKEYKPPPAPRPQNRASPPLNHEAPCSNKQVTKREKDSIGTNGAQLTKLVPYDMDDSSNCSDESSHSPAEAEACIAPKSTINEWKVTAAAAVAEEPSSEGKSWDRKKVENNRNTVDELLRMSHSGYGTPVSSWSGSRAQLDKEVNNERREERKRALSDNSDQGRTKHPKVVNSNGSYKSNPGYNPIQVGISDDLFLGGF